MCSYFCRQGTDARQPGRSRSTASYIGWCVPGRRMPMNPSFLMSMEGHNDDFADRSSQLGDTAAMSRELGSHTMLFAIPGPAGGLVEINMVSSGEDGGVTAGDIGGGDSARTIKHKVPGKVERRPCSIFSKVPLVSDGVTTASSVGSSKGSIEISPMLVRDTAPEAKASSVGCPLEREGLQIASSRPPGIKKRKDQAKKVVCIPAQPAASNKPGGEVVPSDLWAWRKYGQKPIKGSPYPRGYYRCSSSKVCSARKQVERSRTDPSMLVITYTSEHNHPWPTQRNALAGSTRSSQPTKNSPSAMKSPPRCQGPAATVKVEHKEAPSTVASTTATPAKDEYSPETEMKTTGFGGEYHHKLERGSFWDYQPMLPEWSQPDDLFADLGELASHDTMGNLVFSEEFMEDKPDEGRENTTTMDPFNIFDWAANSFGETVRRVL